MENLEKLFGEFTFKTKVMPVLVSVFPILLYCVLCGYLNGNLFQDKTIQVILFLGTVLLSILSRNRGKDFESNMYKRLGAKPTTIVMRYSNDIVDDITKKRYHEALLRNLPELTFDDNEGKEQDRQYDSAVNWLRNYANSNRKTEFRVFNELIYYNFIRNLYGMKQFAVGIASFSVLIDTLILLRANYWDFNVIIDFRLIPLIGFMVSIVLLLILVNDKSVEAKAFDYAKTLFEVCERI